MAEGRGELEVYNQWFAAADLDRDGVLSGLEAVQFFQRSGLPQNPTLFKVWQYVAGDRPALSRQEFYTAMKLVSLAQLNGGVLDDQQALRLVNGLAGPVPLPRLQGMSVPRGIDLPAHLLPPGSPGAPQAAPGAGAPQRPAPPAPAGAQASPARPAPAVPPSSPPPAAGAAFPPLSGEQAAAYQTAFSQLDTDRDGFVQGTDCFGAFMQSGLPKASLKQIWDLVAGDEPRLNRHQFVQALYLIDCTKRGMPVPAALPPGPFPPVAGTVSLGTMQGAPADIYSASLSIPEMVPRAVYQAQPVPPQPFASQVPSLPRDRVTALDAADQLRLEGEREAALAAEAEQRKADEERAAAAAKKDFFTKSLADMRLVQSKVNRAVVEAQQRCEMERAAADQMEADYNRAYAEFSMKHAQSAPLVEQLKRTQEEKAALQQKVDSLKVMVAQLEDFDPDWESREKGECERLNQEIAELTVQKERLQRGADALEKKRGVLLAQIATLKEAGGAVEGELGSLQEQVDKVAAEAGKEKEAVVALLRKLAPLYNKLYDAAKAALVPLPAEAVATMKREASPFRYDELAGAAATDWGTFKDEGFKIVSALPVDTRLSTFAAPTTAALDTDEDAAAAQPAAAAAPAVAPAAEGSAAPTGAAAAADPAVEETAEPAAAAAEPAAAEGDAAPLAKTSSSAAEAEAVSAAAEAGVLASAIAEALASVPAPKAKGTGKAAEAGAAAEAAEAGAAEAAAAGAEDGTAVAEAAAPEAAQPEGQPEAEAAGAADGASPFEVSFDDGPAGAAAAAAAPVAGADAFAAFDAPTDGATAADGPPVVKNASGAFGSSQALGSESPMAAVGGAAAADKATVAAGEHAPAAAGDSGWTAF